MKSKKLTTAKDRDLLDVRLPMSPAIRVKLTVEATSAGPILAEMLARLLGDLGATVKLPRKLTPASKPVKTFEGLQVEIVRVVHIIDRDECKEREKYNRKLTTIAMRLRSKKLI